ncbi:hypothetical protein BDY17DRAFT_296603 [Neohortaea acidophila]|uniref:RNAse P Rpr2/Rpp21/SNM1 subunit domain-containing protein n=1 Tax=Neohortaea acidophila TaxID=245834 RepID=A0A6A6PTH7_9PEZI|nr:uncharacterized protein BDY17DRAFT_296603 [Neohortaea acidophila]KAF2482991.1 hypothetical protein BDY17DRAFT_296603 [Neohortaea acidophila]
MTTPAADARLRFLNGVAERLMVSSPATSAYVQSVRLAALHNDESRDGGDGICTACGNILIFGWSCDIPKTEKRTRSTRIASSLDHQQRMAAQCVRCDSSTFINKAKRRKTKRSPQTSKLPQPQVLEPVQSASLETEKPSARRRPRNKKASLQSMIANKPTSNSGRSTGFGLDLMDLMKT